MPTRDGAVILLEDIHGRVAFQLRDNRPDGAYPNYWGLFGGWLEPGETPTQAIQREMMEELGLSLDTARLEYGKLYRDGDVIAYVLRYPAQAELDNAILQEGQRWEYLDWQELQARKAVPRHRDIFEWFVLQTGRTNLGG